MDSQGLSVSLKIRHPHIDPALLTRELGIEPQYCWQAGDLRPPEFGASSQERFRESYWVARINPPDYAERLATPAFPSSTQSGLPSLMFFSSLLLLKRKSALWERLRSEGGQAELMISLLVDENFRLDLPPELLALLSATGMSVSIDVVTDVAAAA